MDIDYHFLSDGSVVITNVGKKNIEGLSFAVMAKKVFVNGSEPTQKLVGQDIIFWFDLKSGESKTISFN